MEKEREDPEVYSIWVDWENRIISFQKAEGFEQQQYPTHEEMIQFAVEKSMSGFAIQ